MRNPNYVISISVAAVLVLSAVLFLWANSHRNTVEQQAYALMTATAQSVLGSSDWGAVLENMDAESPIPPADLSLLSGFGQLVTLTDPEGVIQVPLPFSAQQPEAQFRVTGHFTRGRSDVEAVMQYREGRWVFSHFAYIPGTPAQ